MKSDLFDPFVDGKVKIDLDFKHGKFNLATIHALARNLNVYDYVRLISTVQLLEKTLEDMISNVEVEFEED